MGTTVGVLGASGYTGGELLRLLASHPVFEVVSVSADRQLGRRIGDVHPHLRGNLDLELVPASDTASAAVDVLFSCLPSGHLGGLLAGVEAEVVVDLSDEHRADPGWVYGLTEYARDLLPAPRVANPGCYPTATLLALLPFVKAGVVSGPAIVDAMSGVSGAGRKAEDHLSLASLHGDVGAYGTVEHRHIPEMERALARVSERPIEVSFTPHLIPVARGLLVTARLNLISDLDDAGALNVLSEAYRDEPFVHVDETWPTPKSVAGSNGARVSARVDGRVGMLICSASIDNLGKGAAGQAIQNANLCCGLPETTGLTAVGVWP
ncbi:MAG: N-acetyl-gamma-glutamyl-phosphate reductase [Actinomycetota bacterium]